MALIARGLSEKRFNVHLGLITQRNPTGEVLPDSIQLHGIGAHRVLAGAPSLLRLVRTLKPDLILSGMFHLNFLVLLLRPLFPRKTIVLVRQNGATLATCSHAPRTLRFLYRTLYPLADGIVCQTQSMANEVSTLIGNRAKVHVLENPVDVQAIRATASLPQTRWNGAGPHLLAIGRLSSEKGFDLLLKAFAEIRPQFPKAGLTILGAGPDEQSLKALCHALGLDSAMQFLGHVPDPSAWFSGATLFALSSRNEGLPNVLLEAAAAGLPIVATPASRGLAEVIRGRSGTWLAREVSASALANTLSAALQLLTPGQRFRHDWIESYDAPRAIGNYEQLMLEVLKNNGR